MTPRAVTFELERFTGTPATDRVVLLEVEGRLAGAPARGGAPRLLVERPGERRREHAPIEAVTEAGHLRLSFAVATADLGSWPLALAVSGLLLDLPAPNMGTGDDRAIRLVREVNTLRHRITDLEGEALRGREVADAAAEKVAAAEREAAERVAAAEQQAAERVAAAEQQAAERLAEQERGAAERVAAEERDAAEHEAELEQDLAQLERTLAEEREEARRRDTAAAGEHLALQEERDAARDEVVAVSARVAELARSEKAARAEADALRRALAERPVPAMPGERDSSAMAVEQVPDHTTAAMRPEGDDDATRVLAAGDGEPADSSADDSDEGPEPDDTGPIPLRRGPRRAPVARAGQAGEPAGSVRALAGERTRAAALPAAPDAEVGPLAGIPPRTLALAAVGVAGFLVLVAVLAFLL